MPLVHELLGTAREALDVVVLGHHHDPADRRHDAEHPDHDPRVDGDRLEQVAEEAEAIEEADLGGLGLAGDKELRVLLALTERRELDQGGASRALGDLHFVDLAAEGALPLLPADEGGTVQGGHGHRQVGHGIAIHIERRAGAVGDQGKVLPGARGQRRRGYGALGAGRPGDLEKRSTVIQTDLQGGCAILAAIDDRFRSKRGRLDPGHPGVGCGLENGGLRIGRNADRLLPVELHAAANHRSLDGNPRCLRPDAFAGGVAGRSPMLVEVIDRDRVGVEGRLGKVGLLTLGRLLLLIARRVEVDVTRGPGLDIGNLHPDESLVHHRIEFLDLGGEHGLVVAVDEAEVASILLRGGEVEVSVMEPHDDRGGAGCIGERDAVVGSVDGELGTGAPCFVPPGAGLQGSGDHKKDDRERKKERLEIGMSTHAGDRIHGCAERVCETC